MTFRSAKAYLFNWPSCLCTELFRLNMILRLAIHVYFLELRDGVSNTIKVQFKQQVRRSNRALAILKLNFYLLPDTSTPTRMKWRTRTWRRRPSPSLTERSYWSMPSSPSVVDKLTIRLYVWPHRNQKCLNSKISCTLYINIIYIEKQQKFKNRILSFFCLN